MSYLLRNLLALILCTFCISPAFADTITYPNTFVAGTAAQAAQVNANFTTISTVVNGNLDVNNLKTNANIAPSQLNLTTEFADLAGTGARTFSGGITGDTVPRVSFLSDGKVSFGPGSTTAQDLVLSRKSAAVLLLTNLAGTTSESYEGNQFDARTNGDANGKYTLNVLGFFGGDGGATAQDVLLKRSSAGVFSIRNAADSADAALTVGNMTVNGTLAYSGTLAPSALAVPGAVSGGSLSTSGTLAAGATTLSSTLSVGGTSTLAAVNAGAVAASSVTSSTPIPVSSGGTGSATVSAGTVFGNNTGSTAAPAFVSSLPLTVLPSLSGIDDFRLTCSNGNPVPSSDITGATTIYLTPYKGSNIALYDGTSKWNILTSAQASLALSATSGNVYDVFAFNSSGSLALESLAWSNTSNRATALVYQDGVLVKSGATTRRYVGSFYAVSSNTTEDSAANRCVFNAVHRTRRGLAASIPTASWTYASSTLRAADANTAPGQGRVRFLMGVPEDAIHAQYGAAVQSTASNTGSVYLGLDSTTAPAIPGIAGAGVVSVTPVVSAEYEGLPGIGLHFIQALEAIQGTGSVTFFGNDNSQFGLIGSISN